MVRTLIATAFLLVPAAAGASSEAAWTSLYDRAARTCLRASHLKAARASRPVTFSDANGQVAMLVTGTAPRGTLKGAPEPVLCLYDRRRGVAEVQEADGWRAIR